MSWASDSGLRASGGQATVEAALMIPLLSTILLMLLQPAVVLYDLINMNYAASEGCRYLVTSDGDAGSACDYIEGHLAGIPDASLFHDGEWDIEVSGDEESSRVSVTIGHAYLPLPLISLGMGMLGMVDGEGLAYQEVSVEMRAADDWTAAGESGLSPDDWVSRWEDHV